MVVKVELADGTFEVFKSDSYKVSKTGDFHPIILSVSVFEDGKMLLKRARKFKWWYKHISFNSYKVQNKLKELEEKNKAAE